MRQNGSTSVETAADKLDFFDSARVLSVLIAVIDGRSRILGGSKLRVVIDRLVFLAAAANPLGRAPWPGGNDRREHANDRRRQANGRQYIYGRAVPPEHFLSPEISARGKPRLNHA
jgi:hypothetical protein